jgi:aminomethyltransferase
MTLQNLPSDPTEPVGVSRGAGDRVPIGYIPTAFHEKMAPFSLYQDWMGWAGYLSANRFESVEAEYFAVRNQATLFDVSPMHKYRIRGPQALEVVNRMVTRDVSRMRDSRVGYAVWCDEDGLVIDDGTVFRFSETEFQICCQEPQYSWITDVAWGYDVRIEDESHSVAGLALQGPTSYSVLREAGFDAIEELKPFDIRAYPDGITISRTGFTGDLGYELWVPTGAAAALWDRLWPAGRKFGLRPIGNEALNLVRLEAGYIAVRADVQSIHAAMRPTRGRTPFEIGLGRLVHFDKGHFNGRRALLAARRSGPRYMLVGLDIEGNKPANDAFVYHRGKTEAGHVTSAMWSPTCKRNLALAELRAPYGQSVTDDLFVEIYHPKEGKWDRVMARAKIVDRPFFRHERARATPPGPF